jgi:hypothetical protein
VERQQKFLKALAKKLLQPSMVAKLPQLAAIAHEYLATDMDLRTMLSLANFARQANLDAIQTATLPGLIARHPRLGSILIPDREKAPQVLADLLGTTFLVAQWEQGAGSVGSLLKVTARTEPSHPVRSHRRHARQPEAPPTEDLEPASQEGVPINHEPVEVVPMPPEVETPAPSVKPEAPPPNPTKPTPPDKNSNTPSPPEPSPNAPPQQPSPSPSSPQAPSSEQSPKR